MPEQETIERARKDAREGKSASAQAGEFVQQEMHHIREGKHGARSTKQAIAIGLSEARRAGVKAAASENRGCGDPPQGEPGERRWQERNAPCVDRAFTGNVKGAQTRSPWRGLEERAFSPGEEHRHAPECRGAFGVGQARG